MSMIRKSLPRFMALLLVVGLLGGCADGEASNTGNSDRLGNTAAPPEPVTLTMFQEAIALTDQDFQHFIAEPVHNKFPNITVQMLRASKEVTRDSLIASGQFPDLIYTGANSISEYDELSIPMDLADMAKKNQFDLEKFDSAVMDVVRSNSAKGNVLAIPFSDKFSALLYNKDIFDKFAVPYPKDLMTWDEVISLARRVTRTADKIQYKGISAPGERNPASILRNAYYDPKTQKAALVTDNWKKVLQINKLVADIPGNEIPAGKERDLFTKDQTLAMMAQSTQRIGELDELYNQGVHLNWDLTSYPNVEGFPGIGFAPNTVVLMLSQTSKHKDAAFQVLDAVTNEDNQMNMSRNGTFSVLKDPKIREAYGTQLKSLQGKNIKGMFKNKYSVGSPLSQYDTLVRKYLNKAIQQVNTGQKDMNTALREAEEGANKEIAELQSK
jgi:multiple sugar transport system substrate-binding protein